MCFAFVSTSARQSLRKLIEPTLRLQLFTIADTSCGSPGVKRRHRRTETPAETSGNEPNRRCASQNKQPAGSLHRAPRQEQEKKKKRAEIQRHLKGRALQLKNKSVFLLLYLVTTYTIYNNNNNNNNNIIVTINKNENEQQHLFCSVV